MNIRIYRNYISKNKKLKLHKWKLYTTTKSIRYWFSEQYKKENELRRVISIRLIVCAGAYKSNWFSMLLSMPYIFIGSIFVNLKYHYRMRKYEKFISKYGLRLFVETCYIMRFHKTK